MELDRAIGELEGLVQALERDGDERALTLLQLVDAVHRPALELIAAGQFDHPLVRGLLAMYDLAPVEESIIVEEALDQVRPYVESHGGTLELLDVDDGVVRLRLSGSCEGCAGSSVTLERGIEAALREHYPGFRKLVAVQPEPGRARLLQLEDLRRPVFAEVAAAERPEEGRLGLTTADGVPVLLANLGGETYAFRNACAVDGLPLEGGRLSGSVIVCPWHNCAYDARSGKRVDDPAAPGLAVVPVAIQGGSLRVAVNVA